MSEPKMQHCFNCGAELGVYKRYLGDEPECCGSIECNRELRRSIADEREDRRYSAEEDDYRRY